eukprot:scaffold70821_cov32-Tisochrysis_lutea.AAC.2
MDANFVASSLDRSSSLESTLMAVAVCSWRRATLKLRCSSSAPKSSSCASATVAWLSNALNCRRESTRSRHDLTACPALPGTILRCEGEGLGKHPLL